ncbi:MAG: ubiquitin-like small modifier protein 1 [Thermoplasmatota archaeon]
MAIKIKFFASLREIVGEEEISMEKDDLKDVGDVLKKISLSSNKIQKRFYDDGSTLNKNLIVLKDGRNINYLEGLNTSVEEDDTIAVFPVIAGG